MRRQATSARREIAPHAHDIVRKPASDAEARGRAALRNACLILDLNVRGFRLELDASSFAGFTGRSDSDAHGIIVDGERAHFSAEVPLHVVPKPAIAERVAAKIALVANDATAHAAHAPLVKLVCEFIERRFLIPLRA